MMTESEVLHALMRATVNAQNEFVRDAISKKLGRDDWSLGELQDRVSVVEMTLPPVDGFRRRAHSIMLDGLEIAYVKGPTMQQELDEGRRLVRYRVES